jgi:GMP synthase-like glutamine amidotransferase
MVVALQHVPWETMGTIEQVLLEREIPFRYARGYAGDPIPGGIDGVSGLVIMGGPMGVAGARVRPAQRREIGWYRVPTGDAARTDRLFAPLPSQFVASHWHGDFFGVPGGAVSVARSEMTECQAFRLAGVAYGLLCHLEVTSAIVESMVREFEPEWREAQLDGAAILGGMRHHLEALQGHGRRLAQGWADLVAQRPSWRP